MTDGLQGLREDVAFMRALAEEGRAAPITGGSMMAAAGLIFSIASLVFYAELTGAIDPPGSGLIWLVAMVVYAIAGTFIVRRLMAQPGYAVARNRATGVAWSAIGYAIFAIAVCFAVGASRTGQGAILSMFAPVILALYGSAWSVAGLLSRAAWLGGVAATAFVSAVVTAWFANQPEQFLVYAAALVLTALFPGLYLMRQARSGAT